MVAATAKKRHLRRGNMRLIVHIIALLVLGALLVALGFTGLGYLKDVRAGYYSTSRANIYKDKTAGIEGSLKALFVEHVDNEKTLDNKVFAASRKSVNAKMDEDFGAFDETEMLMHAINTYTEKAAGVFPEKAEEIRTVSAQQAPSIIQGLIDRAEDATSSISLSRVKGTLSPNATKNYIIMYYWQALLIIGGLFVLVGLLLMLLWFTRDEDGRARVGQAIEPFDYLLPFLVGVGVFTFYPMIRVLIMSFQENYHLTGNNLGEATGWGIGNYKFILSGAGSSQFWRSLKNTALFVLFTVPITAAISIVIAYLLNQKTKLRAVFQTAYFMPMVTTATAVGLVWRWMFNQNYGMINALIAFFTRFFGAPENVNWLQTGGTNHVIPMAVLIIYGIWSSLPFTIILLLSGLQNIDENLYTVAKVDGSKPARIFFRITVPLLSPTIGLVLIINSISAFKVYTDVFVLWNGAPENFQMETVAWYIYNNISSNFDGMHSLGYAAAAAMVLFVIIFIFTMVQKWIQRNWVYQ
ncbi:MAG: sugar ABC transporter permease [Clostridia bacterium]|nr:sugar ABC transporter permease [Clostridia bacterium]